ncbi:MAG: transglutaminase domain-containing protein [Candidatus Goldbacteria bacterium]|nr:transglutaminase domain-containing protein [Candidatus Goldiibacteriota bacterium]
MRKKRYLIIVFLLLTNTLFSYEESINKYRFEVYYMIKGRMKKNIERPDFGWRILKTFPVNVREFTFTSQFYNYNSDEIAELAKKITDNLSEARKKNAIHVADEIYKYINDNVESREINKEIINDPHRIYFSYRQVLKEKKGCDVEKCRLAVTLLRYFTIPARMIYADDHYAVEYFIMPLKGKGDWFRMDFTDTGNKRPNERSFPVYWHPLDCRETLNETWNVNCYVNKIEVQNVFLDQDEQKAEDTYSQITMSVKNIDEIQSEQMPERGQFIMLKRVLYELWLPSGQKDAEINFILPFNSVDFFRTKYWMVKSIDNELDIKMKRIYTEIKPPQEGMIITLPVKFTVIND